MTETKIYKGKTYIKQNVNLIRRVKKDMDFPWAAPRYFSQASILRNPSEQPCKPLENPIHPSSFLQKGFIALRSCGFAQTRNRPNSRMLREKLISQGGIDDAPRQQSESFECKMCHCPQALPQSTPLFSSTLSDLPRLHYFLPLTY